jgi:hypothetical protein
MILPKRLWLNRTRFEGETGIFFKMQYFREFYASSRRIYCLSSYYKYSKMNYYSPQGNISVTILSFANSGSNSSMIFCGSGQRVASLMMPNWTPPP